MRHAGPGGAAALQDAGAVHDDGSIGLGAVQHGLLQRIAFRNAQFQGFYLVVQREVQHIFALHRVHVGHQFALVFLTLGAPVKTGAHKLPFSFHPGIQVQTAHAHIGHVGHVEARIGPLGVNLGGAGAETDVQAGRIGAQVPKGIPHYAMEAFGEAAVAGAIIVIGLSKHGEGRCVLIHNLLGRCNQASGQQNQREKKTFFHMYKISNFCSFVAIYARFGRKLLPNTWEIGAFCVNLLRIPSGIFNSIITRRLI